MALFKEDDNGDDNNDNDGDDYYYHYTISVLLTSIFCDKVDDMLLTSLL